MTPEELKYFLIVQSKVHLTFIYSWSKSVTVYTLRNGARLQHIKHFATDLLSCRAPAFPFWGILHCIKNFPFVRWRLRFQKCPLSFLEGIPLIESTVTENDWKTAGTNTRPQLFKSWIASAVHRINHYRVNKVSIRETNCVIHWIEIYPMDSAIQLLHNWGLVSVNWELTVLTSLLRRLCAQKAKSEDKA